MTLFLNRRNSGTLTSLEDAYEKINAWVEEYNHFRPHSSLDDLTPAEVVESHQIGREGKHKNEGLPAASTHSAMYFATAENNSAASENT